ncbi:MAG: DUF3179 domain-containing (seleno)protein [bacterium]
MAAVYSRELAGLTTTGGQDSVLTLSASGWTYSDTFVLYDYETESLWYHLEGEDGLTCISGPHADRTLEEFRSTKTRGSAWKADHPETKFMDPASNNPPNN